MMSCAFRQSGKNFINFSRSYPLKTSPRWSSSFTRYDDKTVSLASLGNHPPTRLTILDNGMRIATEDTGVPSATVGLYIDIGSRSESEETNGMTHFIEHMLFKGTQKRSRIDLELEISNLGANLMGETTREQTAFWIKCISKDVPKAIDILSDIFQNSKFDEADIESVKNVIIRDLNNEGNNLQSLSLNNLHSVAYQGTSLGFNINGTEDNIRSFEKRDLLRYKNSFYQPGNVVLVGAGGVDHDSLVKLAEDHFKGLKNEIDDRNGNPIANRYTGSDVKVIDETMPLCHVSIAQEGVGWGHADYLPLMIARNVVGSWDKTHGANKHSASNLARYSHRMGLSHAFESFNISYKNTGLFGIYFVSEQESVEGMIYNIMHEWKRLCTNPSNMEINRAINAFRTQLHMEMNSTHVTCQDIARQVINSGRRLPLHELHDKIERVTPEQVKEAMFKHIYNNCPVISTIGMYHVDYNEVRGHMYWIRV